MMRTRSFMGTPVWAIWQKVDRSIHEPKVASPCPVDNRNATRCDVLAWVRLATGHGGARRTLGRGAPRLSFTAKQRRRDDVETRKSDDPSWRDRRREGSKRRKRPRTGYVG